ncbi:MULTISPECIES: histidinol dehydrogenase [unclassified Peribacillus]|uniref:histidinol dehydrogenase n=1 Tax=unclassified Peribacillus TaxID=2675266 RepID=UPI001914C94A|nr:MULTISPECIES: histidinol dehydrogenase [unclassified Peribacillus]MBK5441747.1 histidinol dehydrogenase [Peribacillus sp. TH24]MBK5458334.1 histidinol dehydrogenase [Peribacillus sp. TH27]
MAITYLKSAEQASESASPEISQTVKQILEDIKEQGIKAVRKYSQKFDMWNPESFRVDEEMIEKARRETPPELRASIDFAREQVDNFARRQRSTIGSLEVETMPGVTLGHKLVPVNAVGCYVPGGRYPLISSAIMTITTAKAAGVSRVIACAPPTREGGIHAPQLYAMAAAGADEIYCFGGVQALAAMAYGVDGIKPVDMIVGAGNAYVAEAKRQLFGPIGIDLLAGPTEALVIADESADARLVAADLLGQAEHGPTSQVVLVTDSELFAQKVIEEVEQWLKTSWPTAEVSEQAWKNRGEIILCDNREEVLQVADEIASEHVELQTSDNNWYFDRLTNYGSLFIGARSTVAYGDKAIGTNHVLPTDGAARYTGGLWVGKFLKTLTYQKVSEEGTRVVAPHVAAICDAERMEGHAITARLRLEYEDNLLSKK